MIDATYMKAHRTATSMAVKKGGRGRLIGRTKGGLNTKLRAICDSQWRPISLFVTAGQVSHYIGARALLSSISDVDWLLGDQHLWGRKRVCCKRRIIWKRSTGRSNLSYFDTKI